MIAGLLAGLLAAAFGALVGEASIARAIAYESAAAQFAGEAPEPEIVSREVQRSVGLLTAGGVYGAAIGGLFGLAFAFANGRFGRIDPRAVAALLACAGFIAIALAPALKYPAAPPVVGAAETIGARTAAYFVMALGSALAMIVAAMIGRTASARLGAWSGGLIGAAVFLGTVAVAAFLLPPAAEAPADFPADLLWRFRLASLGVQAVLWGGLGLGFAALTPSARRAGAGQFKA
jgi:hypothetical protein